MTDLSVNVDHIATLRQARGTSYPDPVDAARIAEAAGASGITIHLRGDRRHIQDRDLAALRETVAGKLNLEMAPTDEMVAIATQYQPDQVTLVPERPEEITTEGGLDLTGASQQVLQVAGELSEIGISVSVFIDPEPVQIEWLLAHLQSGIRGYELNTDRYASTEAEQRLTELSKIRQSAEQGAKGGFSVYAGHALTTDNVAEVSAIPWIEELNIGHYLVSRSTLVGMSNAVDEMLLAMASDPD